MIDFHAHQPSTTGLWGLGSYAPGDYVAFMDEAGIEASVVFTTDGLVAMEPDTNDKAAAFAAADPGRLLPFGTVDPYRPGAAAEAERCLRDLGMHGLKFHPWLQGFAAHTPLLDEVCEVAGHYAAPLVFHDGTPPYSTALQIAVLARRHPAVQVVLGHAGLFDLWRETIAAVTTTGNVHACLCGPPIYAIRRIVEASPADRVLFGTDAGVASTARQPYVLHRIAQLSLAVPDQARRQAILRDNPRRLLPRWAAA